MWGPQKDIPINLRFNSVRKLWLSALLPSHRERQREMASSVNAPHFHASVSAVGSNKNLVFCLRRSSFGFRPSNQPSSLFSPIASKLKAWKSEVQPSSNKIYCSLAELESENDEACELVNGTELSLGDGDDLIRAYLFTAVKNNNGTGILLLSDIYGFEDSSTREFAYRVACNGYNVLLPDLFRGDPWTKDRPKNLFEQWYAGQQPDRVAKDIGMAKDWLVNELLSAGISKKLGVIGFCFGGGRVIDILAKDESNHFSAGVSFYGTRIDRSTACNINVPILFISGDEDPLCPVSLLRDIENSIGRGSRVVIFEGRGHGFAHQPNSPDEDKDAEQAFLVMRSWLDDELVAGNSS
ncbi:carboxymethylenebutenolidase homolog [Rhodamnia argentea]|uniref:Carboxymethylenebutenolidase homolog n=1 Tax=Rhodamnia argentea TaxID=178133 RepID=A0A8B8NJ64_9MYRT|nr:carboxymethylenebutenolidase homolog [Rhodamnia argentea]